MRRLVSVGLICLVAVWIAVGTVAAQESVKFVQPDEFLRELDEQKRLERIQRGNRGGRVDGPDQPQLAVTPGGDGPQILIRQIVTSESEVLSPEDIRAVASTFEGVSIAVSRLNEIVDAFNRLYVERNFRAGFAVLPEQAVESGVIQVILIEARIDTLTIEGNMIVRTDYLRSRIPLKQGDLLSLEALEKALLLVNKGSPSGFQLAASLSPGTEFATTRVILVAKEPPRFRVNGTIDNHGSNETGRTRYSGNIIVNSLTGRDDPLIIGGSLSRGSEAVFATYDTPIFRFNTRLMLQGSASQSRVIAGPFAALDLQSKSLFGRAVLRQPVFVDALWELNIDAGVEGTRSDNQAGPLKTRTEIGKLLAGIDLEKYDSSGVWIGDAQVQHFAGKISGAAGPSSQRYTKFVGTMRRYQSIGPVLAIGRVDWQLTGDRLLPSVEQFQLGGIGSVRAYQSGQFSGDEGFSASIELRLPIDIINESEHAREFGTRVELIGFFDAGGAFPFRANGNNYQRADFATGLGGGISVSKLLGYFDATAFVAQPLDDVHQAIHNGKPRGHFEITGRLKF